MAKVGESQEARPRSKARGSAALPGECPYFSGIVGGENRPNAATMADMSESPEDEINRRVFKVRFTTMPPEMVERVRELTEMEPDALPTDSKTLADDLQTMAAMALNSHENVELLIQLLEQIGKTGSIEMTRPEPPPKRKRF